MLKYTYLKFARRKTHSSFYSKRIYVFHSAYVWEFACVSTLMHICFFACSPNTDDAISCCMVLKQFYRSCMFYSKTYVYVWVCACLYVYIRFSENQKLTKWQTLQPSYISTLTTISYIDFHNFASEIFHYPLVFQ